MTSNKRRNGKGFGWAYDKLIESGIYNRVGNVLDFPNGTYRILCSFFLSLSYNIVTTALTAYT